MIRWLARYEITVDSGTEVRRFRFTGRRDVRWALRFPRAAGLGDVVRVSARDRWTGRRFA